MRRAHGFTLTEVLVALAVVALVLVALLGSMQAVVASATNIYDRTLAGWIAVDKVTEYRLGTEFPEAGEESGEVDMANLDWVYTVTRENVSQSDDILTVTVKVASALEPEITLGIASGTLIRPSPSAAAAGPLPGAGGPPGVVGGARMNGVGANGGGFGGPDTSLPSDGIPDFVTDGQPPFSEGERQ
jgi:general secretion pathway protein I